MQLHAVDAFNLGIIALHIFSGEVEATIDGLCNSYRCINVIDG
jgi:hypothetical protein